MYISVLCTPNLTTDNREQTTYDDSLFDPLIHLNSKHLVYVQYVASPEVWIFWFIQFTVTVTPNFFFFLLIIPVYHSGIFLAIAIVIMPIIVRIIGFCFKDFKNVIPRL